MNGMVSFEKDGWYRAGKFSAAGVFLHMDAATAPVSLTWLWGGPPFQNWSGWRLRKTGLREAFYSFQIDANGEPKFAPNAPRRSSMSDHQLLSVGHELRAQHWR